MHESDKNRTVKTSRMVKKSFVTTEIVVVPKVRKVRRTVMKAVKQMKY